MNAEELARKVAQDLKPEFGPEVAASTEAAIRGEQSRGWGEAAHIGAFVLSACRLMWEIYKDYKTTPELRNAVAARLEKPAGLSQKKADAIIDEAIEALTEVKS